MAADARDDRAVARWALRTRDCCKELRTMDFVGAGAVQFLRRQSDFVAKSNEIVNQAKDVLRNLQIFADIASTTDTTEAIKEFVFNTTEHIDIALDRHDEELKHGRKSNTTPGKKRRKDSNPEGQSAAKRPKPRPQDFFDPPVDNTNTPFLPDFTHLRSISSDLGENCQPEPAETPLMNRCKLARHAAQLSADSSISTKATYKHPFATALDQLPGQYPAWILQKPTPHVPEPMQSESLTYVEDGAALAEMAAHLLTVRDFAVDLEHSSKSFQGFTCLMQISTRSRDYIVDTLALRSQLGAALARPFSEASILKVLHGANSDVMWLQKDFGLFLVNMMDTGQAAGILDLPRGLAGLLQHFCGVSVTNKKAFQTCDWSLRPLTAAMLRYAQSDTHYLLYIADRLREMLLDAGDRVPEPMLTPLPDSGPQGALGTALECSRQLCTHLYEKPLFSSTGPNSTYVQLYSAYGVHLNEKQQAAFAALVAWRDVMCRRLDEGIGRMMPKDMLVALSRDLPQTAGEVGRLVRQKLAKDYTKEIADVVIRSQNHPIETPLEVQMASPNGQCEPAKAGTMRASSYASPSTETNPRSADAVSDGAREECPATPAAQDGSAATGAGVSASQETKPKGHVDDAVVRAAGGSVTAQFSFAGLPAKPVRFSGKSGAAASVAAGEGYETALGPKPVEAIVAAPAVIATRNEQTTPKRSMASMFAAPVPGNAIPEANARTSSVFQSNPAVAAAVPRKPAVKSMAGMFGAPAPKAPKLVHKLQTSAAPQPADAPAASPPIPAGDAAEGSSMAVGAKDAEQWQSEVRCAMASLRQESADAQVQQQDHDDQGTGVVIGEHDAARGGQEGDEPVSLRERFSSKGRSLARSDEGTGSMGRRSSAAKKCDTGAVLGDVTSITFGKKPKMDSSPPKLRGGNTHHTERRQQQAECQEVFDYEAVLDGSDRPVPRERRVQGARDGGRGQRGGRRGGRGNVGGRNAWNPFQVYDADIGAAKRTGNSRNGNRSGAFANK